MIDWSQACNAQLKRPLWQQQQANYGGSLFAVSILLPGLERFAGRVCAATQCWPLLLARAM